MSPRQFTAVPAVRERTPLLVSIVSPSGAGKTKSALRLADGMQRVTGGATFVVDTEARRALHYAGEHKFMHVPFGEPFGPLDYLDVWRYCVSKGATTIITDSMSHEHIGAGGILEMHGREHQRLGGKEGTKMLAWSKPKQEHQRMLTGALQLPCNFIFCYRAKEKLEIRRKEEPLYLGWMPLGSEDFIFEMTISFLLHPQANGIPTVAPTEPGEKVIAKVPAQFRPFITERAQLSEDIGEQLARWAAGGKHPTLLSRYASCPDLDAWKALELEREKSWKNLAAGDKVELKTASEAAVHRLTQPQPANDNAALTEDEVAEIARREGAGG